uniref:muscle, skeletal receptor tyrosine protein kinase-like n=1 Tax=Styela clava TaxID=7725 RepID=UPI00193A9166|nr:muscle, skeletal receptor tyrosine protein kinase-like [Styela clava]
MMLSETKLTVTLYKGEKEILCMVSGFPTTTVQWMKGKMTKPSIRSNKQSRVEQKLVLNLKQLTIADEGQYKCLASNTVGKTTTSISKTVDITVPSQPSILNITTSPCNSSLWITWKPHLRGIGIKHRFRIVDLSNSTNHIIFFATPNKISITLNVAGLQPSTPYFIKINGQQPGQATIGRNQPKS